MPHNATVKLNTKLCCAGMSNKDASWCHGRLMRGVNNKTLNSSISFLRTTRSPPLTHKTATHMLGSMPTITVTKHLSDGKDCDSLQTKRLRPRLSPRTPDTAHRR